MTEFFLILLAACLANNLVTDHLLGVSPLLAAAQKINIAVDMAIAVTGVTTLVAFITCLLDTLFITPLHLEWSLIWDTHKLETLDFYDTIYRCPELNDETLYCHD